ncbi:MAG: ATP-binding protein [Anaerolineales bacterium]|nr:ATP-binding protein [Anaerolineales bacterium]
MKIPPQVRIFPTLTGGIDLADVALVLDQLPQPSLLLNPAADQILIANAKACELFQFTIPQFQQSSLRSIVGSLPSSVILSEPQTFSCEMITATGAIIQGTARLQPLPKRSHWLLLVFTPSEPSLSLAKSINNSEKIWRALDWAHFLLADYSLTNLLSQSLDDLMKFSSCENGYLYTALSNQTFLQCTNYKESTGVFPQQLSVKALAEISAPTIWTEKQPPKTQLAKLAQECGQRFLLALPLGETNARVGLIILSSSQELSCPIPIEEWAVLTQYLSNLVQLFYQTRNLEKEHSILSRENSIHRRLLNSIQEGIILINQEQRILYMNSSAETILGYTSVEAINQTVQTFLISKKDLSAVIHNTLQGAYANQVRSVHLYRRSGQSFLADLQLIPLRIDQKVNGMAILIQDRTEQEALLKQSMRMEQRAVLGEFTTLFAHEARNPINNITANLQWMAMNLPVDDPNQAIIQRIQQNCERLNDLMDTILTYNRISEIEMEIIDIQALVKKVLDRQSMHLQQANIHLNYEPGAKLPPIRGNRRALERVFANLIDNAVHSMRENGGNLTTKIQLVSPKEGKEDWVEISIADSGPGIAEEYRDKLFKKSFTTKSNGSGIGLMICHKIVQAHKGVIDYQSIPGGTVFIVRLPLASSEESIQDSQE